MSLTSHFWSEVQTKRKLPKEVKAITKKANKRLYRIDLQTGKVVKREVSNVHRKMRLGKGSLMASFKEFGNERLNSTTKYRNIVHAAKTLGYTMRDEMGNLIGTI